MKLISILRTTLLRLGVLSRPDGQIYLPEAIADLQEEFKFLKLPDLNSDSRNLEFSQGRYKNFGIETLGLYDDGIVLRSSTDSRRLDELMTYIENWAKKKYDVVFLPSQHVGTIYESNLVVQLQPDLLSKVFRKISGIEKSLKSKLSAESNLDAGFSLGGITCNVDSSAIDNFKPAAFKLERKSGSDPKLGHFFSTAPLTTDSHLALLSEFEKLAPG